MNNIYHRYIDVPFEVPKPERFETPGTNHYCHYFDKSVATDEMKTWLQSYGLTVSNQVEGFYTAPKRSIDLHTDTHTKPGEADGCVMNFTWGPANSVTRWWKIRDENKLIKFSHDTHHTGLDKVGVEADIENDFCWFARREDADIVYEKHIIKPSLLNIGQLHDTYNPSETDIRWTLSFTMLKNGRPLLFAEALDLFADLISE